MSRIIPLRQWVAAVVPVDLPFADVQCVGALPLAEREIHLAAHYYPIVVRFDGPEPVIAALIDSAMLARSMTDTQGRWSGAYRPIALRCLPLRLAGRPRGDAIADLEVVQCKAAVPTARVVRLIGGNGSPTGELKAIHEGLVSVWEGQQKLRAALDFLVIADLLVPLADPEAAARPGPYHVVDRNRAAQLTPRVLEAMTRSTFATIDLLTALTFSQSHLRADLRSPLLLPAAGVDGVAPSDNPIAAGIDTITPWLDTSALFPAAWAADPDLWALPEKAVAPSGQVPVPVTVPAVKP